MHPDAPDGTGRPDGTAARRRPWRGSARLLGAGALLLAGLIAVRVLSAEFEYARTPPPAAAALFIGMLMALGGIYAALLVVLPSAPRSLLAAALAAGVIFRVLFFGSAPVYEDDWYRYLWDGAVLSAGLDPYASPPADAALTDRFGNAAPPPGDPHVEALRRLGGSEPHWPERVNYPYLSTIYPPVAQLAFAAAHQVSPFSLDAWRLVLLVSECAAALLLVAALRTCGRNPLWMLLYWWNPLVIVTVFNAGHMDALLVPFLLGALLLVQRNRPVGSALCLAAAAGVKLWPLILAPVLLRPWRRDVRRLAAAACTLAAASAVLLAPLLLALDPGRSGLLAYADSWERNAFLFGALSMAADRLTADGDLWARVMVALTVAGASLWLGLFAKDAPGARAAPLLAVTALLFFLSPTGYPWYAIWLFLFLPFVPHPALVCLAVTLPLYYARFPLGAVGQEDVFGNLLVPLQFGIPLLVLLRHERFRPCPSAPAR